MTLVTHNQSKEELSRSTDEGHRRALLDMPLHGQFFKQQAEIPNADIDQSFRWTQGAHLRYETESLICAAQEQALATNHIKARIWKNGTNSKCRLCKEQNETVTHIVSGCKMLAATKYLYRHNQIAKYLHWCLAQDMGVDVPASWLDHKPQE
jgi:hypothetical protein